MTSKKLLSCILAAAMSVTTVPIVTANATDTFELTQANGSTGRQLTITLNIPFKDATASDFTFTAPTDLTYSGSNKTATVTSSETGMGAVTVGYYSDADCTTTAVPKNVGTYYVGITLAEGANYNASSSVIHDSSWTFEITKATPNAPAAPTATSDNITKNSIKLTAVTDCEYSIDGTNYQDSPEFTGLTPGMEYTFYQRIKASDNTEQSAASESAAIRTAPDTYGLTITLTIGVDDKTASDKAYANTNTEIDLSDLIVSGYTPGAVSIVEDTNSILYSTPTFDSGTKKLTYKFKENATANKTAKVRIPLTNSDQTDSYNIDVTLTVLSAPQQETGSDTVIWDAPSGTAETGSSSSNASDQIKVKSDSGSPVPTVDTDAGTITLSSEGTLTINETGSGNNVTADCTIDNAAGGTITVDTKTDDLSTITAEGNGTQIKLGSFEETLSAGDKMTISSDGKYGKFEDSSANKTIFVNADSDATVEMPKTLTTTQNGETIKAMEVKKDIGNDAVKELCSGLSAEDQKKVTGSQGISAKVVTIENGERKELKHSTFDNQITIIIPFSAFFQNVRFLAANFHLYYVNATALDEITGNDFVVDNTANKRKASLKSNHCSDWVLTNNTEFDVVINAGQHGTVTADRDPAKYKYGEEVTLTVTPESGYRYTLSVTDADGNAVPVSGDKFKMPVGNVTVTATFTKQSSGGGSYIDYTYKVIDGVGYRIHPKYVGVYEGDKEIEDVVILSEVDGLPVTTIEAGAFNSFRNMKTIELPDTLTTIEQGAFWGCSALEEIDIPESVTSIGSNAFSHCTNLKKVIIRNKDCTIYQTKETISNDYVSSSMGYTYTGTIYGYTGSTAESYANRFKYTFEDIEKLVPVLGTAEAPTVDSEGVVHWNAVENAVKYRIVKEYGGKTYFGKETTETSYQQNNTKVDVEHTIYIRSFDESGNYTDGAVLTVPAKLGTAKAPTVDSEGVVSWSAVKNAVSYKIVKEVNGKTYFGKEITETSYKQNNVVAVEYRVYIRAFGKDGSYTDGEVTTITEKTLGKVAAPTVAKDGTVSWTAAKNAVKYKVVKIVNGVYYGGSVVTGTSYKFKNVPVSDYKVYVIAYGEDNAKTIGNKTTVEVDNSLGYVNDVKVDANGKVTWTKADNATSYRVVKIVGGNKYYGKETKNTNYTFAVKPIQDYQVYVIAYNANKKYTAGKSVTVEVGTLGTVLDPKVDKNGTVTWTAARNAVKYKIGKTVNGKTYYSGEITDTSYTFKNVATKDYKVFVVAFDKDGNKTWGWKVDVKVS